MNLGRYREIRDKFEQEYFDIFGKEGLNDKGFIDLNKFLTIKSFRKFLFMYASDKKNIKFQGITMSEVDKKLQSGQSKIKDFFDAGFKDPVVGICIAPLGGYNFENEYGLVKFNDALCSYYDHHLNS